MLKNKNFVSRRKRICFFVVFILTLEVAIWGSVGFLSLFSQEKIEVVGKNLVIVLDAGHGGIDGGVIGSVTGVKESDLNLATCIELKKRLEERGATIILTRKDKNGLYGNTGKGFKLRDMQKRREIIKNANPDLVISIHMNKFSDGSRSGPQVFFQAGRENGKSLASSIQTALNNFTGNAHSALGGDFYICQCVDMPSVIVECGFLSNATEEAKLCDCDYRGELAEEIVKGIFLYLYSA